MKALSLLAEKYDTDKGVTGKRWGSCYHGFTEYYDDYLSSFKEWKFVLLEIGVGGYDGIDGGGESLNMWAEYFPYADIHGLDIYPKKLNGRFTTHQGDQSDPQRLLNLIVKIGSPMVIIDDGSHVDSHIITSFDTLFPLLQVGGVYIVEDIYRGHPYYDGEVLPTAIDHMLNTAKFCMSLGEDYSRPRAMHFHKGTVIIQK
jgi:hypothetical protein